MFNYTVLLFVCVLIILLTIVIRLWQLSVKKNKLIVSAQHRLLTQSKHLQLIYDTTILSANTEDINQSLNECLDLICKTIGWPIGHIYLVSTKNPSLLESSRMWYLAHPKKAKLFKQNTEKITFSKGVGLPGHVWKSRNAVWICDISQDDKFARTTIPGNKIGVRAAIAFPIIANKKLLAVFEFFSYKKQLCDEELLRAFEVLSKQIGHVFERKISKNHLNFIAHHDSLTGVSNRMQFDAVAKKTLARVTRYNKVMAICLMDLDYFKTVNDSLGHEIGDLLLQAVTKRFLSVLRQADTLARVGGDEFAVIVDNFEKKTDVLIVAKKLIDVLRQPLIIKENEITISVSMGIALFPGGGVSLDELKRNADVALYRAKKSGRDKFVVFEKDERG